MRQAQEGGGVCIIKLIHIVVQQTPTQFMPRVKQLPSNYNKMANGQWFPNCVLDYKGKQEMVNFQIQGKHFFHFY